MEYSSGDRVFENAAEIMIGHFWPFFGATPVTATGSLNAKEHPSPGADTSSQVISSLVARSRRSRRSRDRITKFLEYRCRHLRQVFA